MAQLYKMTLYVCDLEESLSLDEIETLIKQDALDGISVNCICHFADSQIGEQVEWDDNIDLNRCGCPTSIWDKYFKPPKKPKTPADLIRDEVFAKISTDEAMADVILALDIALSDEGKEFTNVYCHGDNGCVDENEDITCNDEMRKTCILRWLQQPAEEV